MAGPVATGELRRASVTFHVAEEADDPGIRRLLRDNPMDGAISLSLEREPHYFEEFSHTQLDHHTIVAREGERVICVGSCSFRDRFVNGRARRVGYLGGLRLDRAARGKFHVLRRGYVFFRELQRDGEIYFTAIASDNERATRFLERAAPGMPKYDYVGDFVTSVLPVRSVSRLGNKSVVEPVTSIDELVAFLNEHNRHLQFAPCWTADDLLRLRNLGLALTNFWQIRCGGKMAACGALWDQRSFKQTVVRAYAPPLSWLRPWINPIRHLAGHPRLPAVGTSLAYAFISHLAVPPDRADWLLDLLAVFGREAAAQRLDYIILGFSESDSRLATLRSHLKAREYRSRLYSVAWREDGAPAPAAGIHNPELALL